jgi:hypothetical protein
MDRNNGFFSAGLFLFFSFPECGACPDAAFLPLYQLPVILFVQGKRVKNNFYIRSEK